MKETILQSAGHCDNKNNYYYNARPFNSQIDYILLRNQRIVLDFKIWKQSYSNVSAHVPVKVLSFIAIPNDAMNKSEVNNVHLKKLIWEKIDHDLYNETIRNNIHIFPIIGDTKDQIQALT